MSCAAWSSNGRSKSFGAQRQGGWSIDVVTTEAAWTSELESFPPRGDGRGRLSAGSLAGQSARRAPRSPRSRKRSELDLRLSSVGFLKLELERLTPEAH